MSADELRKVLGRAFLLALHDDLDRTRERTVGTYRAQRRGVDHDPALVVGRSASEQPPVGDRGLKGGLAQSSGIGRRLYVVVRVQQDGGPIGRSRNGAEDGRVPALDLEQVGVPTPASRRMSRVSSAQARTLAGS